MAGKFRFTFTALSLLIYFLGMFACRTNHNQSQLKLDTHADWTPEQSAEYNTRYRGKLKLIPEYVPTEYVVVSHKLQDHGVLSEYLNFILDAEATPIVLGMSSQDLQSINSRYASSLAFPDVISALWVRDYLARTALDDHQQPVFVALRYFTFSMEFSTPRADTIQPGLFQLAAKPQFQTFGMAHTPIRSEWGNLISTNRHIFAVMRSGQEVSYFIEPGATESEVIQELRDATGLEPILLEGFDLWDLTGHADMFMLPLSDKTIVVSDVDPRTFDLFRERDVADREALIEVDARLDRNAALISQYYEVIRVPLLLDRRRTKYGPFSILTFTNSLIVNSETTKNILIPYHFFDQIYMADERIWEPIAASARDAIRNAVAKEGYKSRFVEVGSLADEFGTVHCTTMQVPKMRY